MTTTPIYALTDTWNDISTSFTAIKMNVTDTQSADNSLLFDLQVGGTSLFRVDKSGFIPDTVFGIADDGDRTKRVRFQASGITTGNTRTLTVPDYDGTIATRAGTETLTNKTLTSPVLNAGVSGTAVLDEDTMSSNSATQIATQQSIKAYADNARVADYTALKALAAGLYSSVTVEDEDRGGIFVWRSGDQSANITNDPGEGIWIPPSSDTTGASGAWQRLHDGVVHGEWWGFVVTSPATTNYKTIWDNMMTAMQAGFELHLPPGTFPFTSAPAAIDTSSIRISGHGNYDTILQKNYAGTATDYFIELQCTNTRVLALYLDTANTSNSGYAIGCTAKSYAITGATQANPVVITATGHTFSNGDVITISGVGGMTELNGNTYTVANVSGSTFELSGVNGSGYTAYTSGGNALQDFGDFCEIDVYVSSGSNTWKRGISFDGSAKVSSPKGIRDIRVKGYVLACVDFGAYFNGVQGGTIDVASYAGTTALVITGDATVKSTSLQVFGETIQAPVVLTYVEDSILNLGKTTDLTINSSCASVLCNVGEINGNLSVDGTGAAVVYGAITGSITHAGTNDNVVIGGGQVQVGDSSNVVKMDVATGVDLDGKRIVFDADADTYQQATADDQLDTVVAGTTRQRIGSTGNMGVYLNGATVQFGALNGLYVAGTSAVGFQFVDSSSTNATGLQGYINSGAAIFGNFNTTGGTLAMYSGGGLALQWDNSQNAIQYGNFDLSSGHVYKVNGTQVITSQQTTGVAEATFVENSGGTAVNVDSTFDGYTLQQIAKALRNHGLLA